MPIPMSEELEIDHVGKRQLRKTLSLRPEFYVALRRRARAVGVPMAQYLEEMIAADARVKGWFMPARADAVQEIEQLRNAAPKPEPIHGGGVFTW